MKRTFIHLTWAIALICLSAQATLDEVESAADKVRESAAKEFRKFVLDKNVVGRAKDKDGKQILEGNKRRFNKNDDNNFQAEFTYHYETVDQIEEVDDKNASGGKTPGNRGGASAPDPASGPKEKKIRVRPKWVSEHGKISASGGSSLLERKIWEKHEQYSNQTEEEKKREQEQASQGVFYESVFKRETKEVTFDDKGKAQVAPPKNDNGSGPSGKPGSGQEKDEKEPIKVERITMREDVEKAAKEVGDIAYQSVEKAAKEEGKENDENLLPNGTLLREAAQRAYDGLWRETLAGLMSRRANNAIREKRDNKPNLSEEQETCDKWAQKKIAEKMKEAQNDPEAQKEIEKKVNEIKEQCTLITKTAYTDINPRFKPDEKDPKQKKLENEGVEKEDAMQRDLRNQLTILERAGTEKGELQTNWPYSEDDLKADVATRFDENGNVIETQKLTVTEQLNAYNDKLKEAGQSLEEVSQYAPVEINPDLPLEYQIQAKSRAIRDVGKMTEEEKKSFGLIDEREPSKKEDSVPLARTYSELLEQNKKASEQ